MKKKILVTGANGQLGKTIEELYEKNSFDMDFHYMSKEDLDITDKNRLELFFKNNTFDFCINCAAYTNVDQAEKTPTKAYAVNTHGVKNLAEVCKISNTALIHISTDYVFDGEKKTPYSTLEKTNPINVYGKSKLLGEYHIRNLLDKFFIIRTSWLYSKKYGNNFYRNILKWANEGRDLKITTEQIGCPTNTVNLSNFIIDIINNNSQDYGVYHFSDSEIMTWYDFGRKILEENKMLCKVKLAKVEKYNTFARRPKYSVLKIKK